MALAQGYFVSAIKLDFNHVHQSIHKLFNLSDQERMLACARDLWVRHPSAERIIDSIHFAMKMEGRINAPCMLCVAPGGTGKTALIHELRKRDVYAENKMLFVTMHQNANNYNLRDLILVEMGLKVGRRARAGDNLTPEMQNQIKFNKIRGIVIDEVHDALTLTAAQQRQNLSLLKNLSSDIYGLSVFAFGVPAAARVLRQDTQLERRYAVRSLAAWVNGPEYRSFVATYINMLPLKNQTNLKDQQLYLKIFEKSQGLTDNIVKIIQSAAMVAILDKSERITQYHIDNIEEVMENFTFSLRLNEDDESESDD
ncbi:TniB family NTP-binding protein [Pseudomonas putida]|uniref:TniB family NTP-binding protein n=1 Tax=Pseudomonas putida TaxID=303 RepID=UPI0039063A18